MPPALAEFPPAIVVCGNAGTGKSTWARVLAKELKATVLDIDVASEALVEAAQRELGRDPKDRDTPEYKRVFRDAIHETLFALARDSWARVILVAPFTLERRLPLFPEWLSERMARETSVHYFVTEERTRKTRLLARGNPRDAAKFSDYERYAALGIEDTRPTYSHLWFDTTTHFPDVSEFFAKHD